MTWTRRFAHGFRTRLFEHTHAHIQRRRFKHWHSLELDIYSNHRFILSRSVLYDTLYIKAVCWFFVKMMSYWRFQEEQNYKSSSSKCSSHSAAIKTKRFLFSWRELFNVSADERETNYINIVDNGLFVRIRLFVWLPKIGFDRICMIRIDSIYILKGFSIYSCKDLIQLTFSANAPRSFNALDVWDFLRRSKNIHTSNENRWEYDGVIRAALR